MKLALEVLKATSTYKAGNIKVEQSSEDQLIVYSIKGEYPQKNTPFYSPELAQVFSSIGFSTYCDYNEEKNRVELIIF